LTTGLCVLRPTISAQNRARYGLSFNGRLRVRGGSCPLYGSSEASDRQVPNKGEQISSSKMRPQAFTFRQSATWALPSLIILAKDRRLWYRDARRTCNIGFRLSGSLCPHEAVLVRLRKFLAVGSDELTFGGLPSISHLSELFASKHAAFPARSKEPVAIVCV